MRNNAGTATVTTSPARVLTNPNDFLLNSQLEQATLEIREGFKPSNTNKAFDPKIDEYFQFCDKVYPHDPYKYVLDKEKVYRFMFFQAFREKKKSGGNRASLNAGIRFDYDAYKNVMRHFTVQEGEESEAGVGYPTPTHPIKPSTFSQYKAVFRKIFKVQIARRVTSQTWEQIWQMCFDDLFQHVKERAPMIKKQTYQEKVNGEFASYTIVENYDRIEEAFWNESIAPSRRSVCTALRHRYCLLHLTSGILRCESLYRAELSDFIGLTPPQRDTDIHQMFLMINQIPVGKTNHGRVLYGCATRHKDVRLCCIGALAFYLQYRFYLTDEFADFTVDNWCKNSDWFDVKLLVDVATKDTTKSMTNDSYGDKIRAVLKKLQITSSKALHLGKNIGAKILDLLEEESEEIRRMGQWNPSMFDTHYSSKLPMGPIRKLAGYASTNKMYFNTRTTVKPCDLLLRSTPIGKFAYDGLSGVTDKLIDGGSHDTAYAVLSFLTKLNEVFLQDAAAMMLDGRGDGRKEHPVFNELEVFQLEEFKVML